VSSHETPLIILIVFNIFWCVHLQHQAQGCPHCLIIARVVLASSDLTRLARVVLAPPDDLFTMNHALQLCQTVTSFGTVDTILQKNIFTMIKKLCWYCGMLFELVYMMKLLESFSFVSLSFSSLIKKCIFFTFLSGGLYAWESGTERFDLTSMSDCWFCFYIKVIWNVLAIYSWIILCSY